MKNFKPDYTKISPPAPSFYAMADTLPRLPKDASKQLAEEANSYNRKVLNGWKRDCADRFRKVVDRSEIVEVHEVDLYLFLDTEEEVSEKTKLFLVNG